MTKKCLGGWMESMGIQAAHHDVSINGGSPIAGWFISWKIPIYKWMIWGCPLVICHSLLLKIAIEIVDLPMKSVDFL